MPQVLLHRRIARALVGVLGEHPIALISGFSLATCSLSTMLSNTATTIIVLPMAQAVLASLETCPPPSPTPYSTSTAVEAEEEADGQGEEKDLMGKELISGGGGECGGSSSSGGWSRRQSCWLGVWKMAVAAANCGWRRRCAPRQMGSQQVRISFFRARA